MNHSSREIYFEDYLAEYNKGTIVLNIKEAGIENEVLRLVREPK